MQENTAQNFLIFKKEVIMSSVSFATPNPFAVLASDSTDSVFVSAPARADLPKDNGKPLEGYGFEVTVLPTEVMKQIVAAAAGSPISIHSMSSSQPPTIYPTYQWPKPEGSTNGAWSPIQHGTRSFPPLPKA